MNKAYFSSVPITVRNFLNYQSTIKNKSDNTIDQYCLDLRMFLRYVSSLHNGEIITDEEQFEAVDITGITPDKSISKGTAIVQKRVPKNGKSSHLKKKHDLFMVCNQPAYASIAYENLEN